MQLTRFHMLVRDFPQPGEHVLYNTLTDGIVGLDDRALQWMQALGTGAPVGPLEADEIRYLEDQGFLVSGAAADDAALERFMLGVGEGDGRLHLQVHVTESCNLACPYCFEAAGGPRGPGMSRPVEARLLDWALAYIDRHRLEGVDVTWFGGEPLLRKGLIVRTSRRLQDALRARGLRFDCGIVTNGVLLDRAFVDTMVPLGLGWAKVTLDGPRETHDRLRVQRSGAGTWDRIVANMKAVAGRVDLVVGANVPKGEERTYERLVDALERHGLAAHVKELRFKPLMDDHLGPSCVTRFSDVDLEAWRRLKRRAHEAGLTPEPTPALGPCNLHAGHSFVVDAKGGLFRCDALVGDPRASVGSLFEDVPRPPTGTLAALDAADDCEGCAFLPICAGGCRAVTLRRTGTFGPNCEREWFETVGREMVRRRYLDEFYGGEQPTQEAAA